MPNNLAFTQPINELLAQLDQDPSLETATTLSNHILAITGVADLNNAEDVLLTRLKLPSAERYDHWFQPHPYFKSDRACFELIDSSTIPVQAKLYWLQKRSRQFIAGGVHFTPNFEDEDFTRNERYKVGIDFFLSPNGKALQIVLSNRGNLRIIELSKKLNNTQIEIFSKWQGLAQLKTQEAIHTTLWESFKLKTVNEKFYAEIANSFTLLLQHLTSIGKDQEQSKLFASRLLGRLLFCWFLRKKGIIDESMGYFNATGTDAADYYRSNLERLFFLTLNTPIEERDELNKQHQKLPLHLPSEEQQANLFKIDDRTPYLNGGLFEPHENDWFKDDTLTFPAGFFTNLYNHFEEFNFTTDESSPEYEQIAIDPEMLGRVFESLLATQIDETGQQARKAKGAYYTPREIVSYMCKESLRNYLYSATGDKEDVKASIDSLLDIPDSEWAQSKSNNLRDKVKDYRTQIIDALDAVTVLDPACGSGAFPMGMLQLNLRTYERLESRFDPYKTKLEIIQNNIFGIDIEPMAVEIARLRAWLSLIVDEEDSRDVEPLPNLDFKFVCANSLVPLDDDSQKDLFAKDDLHTDLKELRAKYYRATSKKSKSQLHEKYYKLTQPELLDNLEKSNRTRQLKSFDPFKNSHPADFFDADQMFGLNDVDIVIGNPPYVRQEKFTSIKPGLKENYLEIFNGRADLFTYFIVAGFRFLKTNGVFCFITSNKFFVRGYGKNIRRFLLNRTELINVINFGELPVFQASVDSAILLARNSLPKDSTVLHYVQMKNAYDITDVRKFFNKNSSTIEQNSLGCEEWSLESPKKISLLRKIQANQLTLGHYFNGKIFAGIKTGYDDAFVINEDQKRDLIRKTHCADKIIKPWLRGKDVRKWHADFKNLYIIYTAADTDLVSKDQNILEYLYRNRDKLEARATDQKWYEMQQPQIRFTKLFDQPKMIYPDCAKEMRAMYDDTGAYGTMAMYFTPYDPVIMGILNSKLFDWYSRMTFASFGDPWKGGRIIFKTLYMTKFPLPDFVPYLTNEISHKVENILSIMDKSEKLRLENEINSLVYQLYELTPKEIAIIEGTNNA